MHRDVEGTDEREQTGGIPVRSRRVGTPALAFVRLLTPDHGDIARLADDRVSALRGARC